MQNDGIHSNQTIMVDDISINFTASILPDKKFTLLLIHGFGASLQTWDDIYPLLNVEYSVIRIDLKGSGFSSKPIDNNYTMLDQALIVIKIIRQMGLQNIVLVGHSLGGGVALLTYLESVAINSDLNVMGLILIDSVGYPQSLPFFVKLMRNPITRFLSYLIPPIYQVRFVLKKIYQVKERVTSERVKKYAFVLCLPGSRYALHQTAKHIVPKNINQLISKYPTITAPTLIVWGENDGVIPIKSGRLFKQAIAGSQLFVLPNTGHVPHEERPTETLAVINQFLKLLQ